MDSFTIKDLENLSGIKAHTIRIWEQRYSFIKPSRTDTNIRYYSNEELKTILNIALLNKNGYKISHINRMNKDEVTEKILSLSYVQAQQERIVNDLIKAMIDLDLDGLEDILDNYILSRGVEKTVTQIIFPFLDKIGILWQTNHINPAQEHLISNIVRQKLIVGIESSTPRFVNNKTFLLFLPEGEFHELGLLFVYFLLKVRGTRVIYLGSNVPIKDIGYILKIKNVDVVYTHITTQSSQFNTERFLRLMDTHIVDKKIVISGVLTNTLKKKVSNNYEIKLTLQEVLDYVNTM
jgi:MerR family transcriptional regulator, light-induced transcriptional regulator